MSSRRSFLSGLGRLGLLLPVGGTGAVALAEPQTVRTIPAALTFSPEAMRLRLLRHEIAGIRAHLHGKAGYDAIADLRGGSYWPTAQRIINRDEPTWTQCVELAELLWSSLPKQSREATAPDDPAWKYEEDIPVLATSGSRVALARYIGFGRSKDSPDDLADAVVALVEAVLPLGHGQRHDPNITPTAL